MVINQQWIILESIRVEETSCLHGVWDAFTRASFMYFSITLLRGESSSIQVISATFSLSK